ncbi:MAG: hypothetical protein G01um101420_417 [Parcubacteria group bacterium Gr01-1014_20]|nr:MAG: hypothetical protein G01um101420_417 [Parcubacteria group bacterium Gr01-1014_20]
MSSNNPTQIISGLLGCVNPAMSDAKFITFLNDHPEVVPHVRQAVQKGVDTWLAAALKVLNIGQTDLSASPAGRQTDTTPESIKPPFESTFRKGSKRRKADLTLHRKGLGTLLSFVESQKKSGAGDNAIAQAIKTKTGVEFTGAEIWQLRQQ